MPQLQLEDITLGYGRALVIDELSLQVRPGELVTILGANGAGKTTLLNGVAGLIPVRSGRVLLDGENLTGLPPEQLVERGVVLVPERRELFGSLSVETNLRLGGYRQKAAGAKTLERVYSLFPILAERRIQLASTLSGGEQQMLALGRALMGSPRLLMLDEPSVGLAPKIMREILEVISRLRNEGMTILLVEQNARLALSLADRGYVMEIGRLVLEGPSSGLINDPRLSQAYLGGATDYAAAKAAAYSD